MAARFGVSVTAIRKRARREGWTKRLFAATATPWAGPAPDAGASPADATTPRTGLGVGSPEEEALLEGWRAPITIRPVDLARRTLAHAAHAVKTGSGLNAMRLARAAGEIARLDNLLDWAIEDPARTEEQREGQDAMMRLFVREQALKLARILIEGGELPEPYAEARDELARMSAVADAETTSDHTRAEPVERAR
ncbi:hypothetical protein BH09PSE1_BH09PSE1_14790 [soil metagenome]